MDARARIRSDLDTTLLVEAAAGTGKTTVMVGRMIELLRHGKCRASGIAAITFTVKAAAQLRQRFQHDLEEHIRNSGETPQQQRLGMALDEFDDMFIGTIHSFCATLLRERPVEAGISPAFTLLDENDAAGFRARSFQRFIDDLPSTQAGTLDMLDDLGVSIAELSESYNQMCNYPDVVFEPGEDGIPQIDAAIAAVRAFVESCMPGIPDIDAPHKLDKLQQAILKARNLLADPRTLLRDYTILMLFAPKGTSTVTLKNWRDKDEAKLIKNELYPQLRNTVIEQALRSVHRYNYSKLLPLVLGACRRYLRDKRAAGLLDNNDLLLHTRSMLRDHPHVRRVLSTRFAYILVDEFQDVDPIQAEMIAYLAGEGVTSASWRQQKLRPGALFAVGDPKQSIYRFRRADIAIYNEVRRMVQDSNGAILRLSRNFRSLPAICNWVNRAFEHVFPPDASMHQAGQVPLRPVRSEGGDLDGVFLLDCDYTGTVKNVYTKEAAVSVASWIHEAIDGELSILARDASGVETPRKLRHSDILILTRYNNQLPVLAEALDSAGIPFSISGGLPVGSSDELARVLTLLRVLADPEDESAMVAWLRGEWCGVDDAALLRWRCNGGGFKLTSKFLPDMDERIREGLLFIKNSMRMLRSAPPASVISAMSAAWALLADLAAKERGRMRVAILASLLSTIRQLSAQGLSLSDIVSLLERREQLLATASLDQGETAVRLSTLHKAKGLEAPVVIVFTPGAFSDTKEAHCIIDRSTAQPRGAVRLTKRSGKNSETTLAAPADWYDMLEHEQSFRLAEEDRLRYVAATRACNALLLLVPKKGDGLFPLDQLLATGVRAVPRSQHAPAPPHTSDLDQSIPPDPARVETELETRRRTCLAATWKQYDISTIAKLAPAPKAAHGRGAAWGRLIHRLFRSIVEDPARDPRSLTETLLHDENIENAGIDDALALLHTAQTHPLWKRIQQASTTFTELPFGLPHHPENGLPGTLRGDIDLLFRDEHGWVILDYKTDHTGDMLDEFVAFYSPQLREYAQAWKELTGEAAQAVLWFLTPNIVVEI